MSNQTDLDWLARNVHEWPKCIIDGEHRDALLWIEPSKGDVKAAFSSNPLHCFNRNQWLARRAELQNKPSWGEIQDWVSWIVQSSTGLWFGSDRKPEIDVVAGHSFINASSFRLGVTFGDGEVLGDWRDTLERRPDRTRAEMEVELVKAAFKPFTSIEDNQEEKVQQDNGWFERGELPPVGIWCEAYCDGATPERCKVLAYHKQQVAVQWSQFSLDVLEVPGWTFQPVNIERELAIEDMQRIIDECSETHSDDQLGALYDASYRKEPK